MFDVSNHVVCLPDITIKASWGQVTTTMNAEDEHMHQHEQEKTTKMIAIDTTNWYNIELIL